MKRWKRGEGGQIAVGRMVNRYKEFGNDIYKARRKG